jgi:heme a synthase
MARADAAKPNLAVGLWLIGVCIMVYAMILVGGATRLTDSGLSITEWDLGKGLVPPLSQKAWAEEFSLYRTTTEYQQLNRGMSLADFQYIYFWEWGHRFLGKMIGLVFAVPFVVFWIRGQLQGRFWACLGLFALGGMQGAIGWWMVTSGLHGRLDVSSFRLMVHLGMAFMILGLGASVAMGALGWPRGGGKIGVPRWLLWAFCGLVFAQVLMGALVAGIDAGRAYTDWPMIGGEWVPSNYWHLQPASQNFFENPATAQFNHRIGGYLAALVGLCIGLGALRFGTGPARIVGLSIGGIVLLQTGLGIAAVMHGAPLGMSLVHQGLAVLLWLSAVAGLRVSMVREPVTAAEGHALHEVAGTA